MPLVFLPLLERARRHKEVLPPLTIESSAVAPETFVCRFLPNTVPELDGYL